MTAPNRILKAAAASDVPGAWRAFRNHLAKRRLSTSLQTLADGQALGWMLADDLRKKLAPLKMLRQRTSTEWNEWLGASTSAPLTVSFAFEQLEVASQLPRLAETLSPTDWWALVAHLTRLAGEGLVGQQQVDPLVSQLLGCELPVTLAALLPEVSDCYHLLDRQADGLGHSLSATLGTTTVPPQRLAGSYWPLVASWLRTGLGLRRTAAWNKKLRKQLRETIWGAVRLTWPQTKLLINQEQCEQPEPLLLAAAKLLADPKLAKASSLLKRRGVSKKGSANFPSPSLHCEAAAVALFRRNWSLDAPRLALRYDEPSLAIELDLAGQRLLRGRWDAEIQFNGSPVSWESPWTEACWFSDEDVDYLELQATLSHGLRIDRQILLSDDGFLFLADNLIGTESGQLDYLARVPLGESVRSIAAAETRELHLSTGNAQANVLPLALPEWRSDTRRGTLSVVDNQLQLIHKAQGLGFQAPLFLDLASKRQQRPLTWRQLTVGAQRQIQSSDVATGYRVAIGSEQWLFYRSLAKVTVRSILGQQLGSEFVAARFLPLGGIKKLLEIE